jgi:hypothetical protein
MCSEFSWCINRSEFKHNYRKTIDALKSSDLSDYNKILLRKRFIPMVNIMEIESKRVNTAYTLFQIITTLGSIMVPALLSTEEKSISFNSTTYEQELQEHNLYWTIWGISIAVTVSNAFTQLLGLERKYIMRNIHVSQIKKEGWLFLQKAGDIYSKYNNKNYDDFIHIFWKRVERLRHDQIVDDLSFDKFDDIIRDDIPNDIISSGTDDEPSIYIPRAQNTYI